MEDAGINVIHDKTMHDRPSYNESYARSLETIQRLMKKYPTAKYVIDLHRDAAAYAGNKGATVKIGKDTVATYSLVVGSACDNYPEAPVLCQNRKQQGRVNVSGIWRAYNRKGIQIQSVGMQQPYTA